MRRRSRSWRPRATTCRARVSTGGRVADKGKKRISGDYSQIELRVLAHMADTPTLRQAFADGLDIHAMTASEMFGVPIKGMDPGIRRKAHHPEINPKNPSLRGNYERAAINAPIQGSAADIIRRAMIRMGPALEAAGLAARMLMQGHGEVGFGAPEG